MRDATRLRSACLALGLVALAGILGSSARAADEPTFAIEFEDGKMTPLRLDVPANTRFKISLTNKGKTPAEFESNELRLEKVLAAGSASTLVIRTLDPGEYKFFDDFHPDAPQAVLVAK
jgi:hypothetical protein